jgi:succinate dehydrogenase/fumarate reductase flavoprotein subunit
MQLDRRDFLKGAISAGAVAAGSVALSACSPSSPSPSPDASGTAPVSAGALTVESGYQAKWEFEIPPEPIDESLITETIEDDIIVVGAGMAGLTTCCSAVESGASVTLFSASSQPISRGGSNFARNSKVMEARSIAPFDPDFFYYHELRAASFTVDQQKWFRGYNNSEEAMNWMIDIANSQGLDVILERDNTFDRGPNYAHAFHTGDATMVSTGQQGAVEALAKVAEEKGATIIYDTIARQLIRPDNQGRVEGVIAEKADGSGYVKFVARKAVVLATGDFSANRQMLAKYAPHVLDYIGTEELPVDYNTGFAVSSIFGGDGQKMGLWIGAAWQSCYPNAPMWQGSWGGNHEPLAFHWGLNVNIRGERYQREDVSTPYSANHLRTLPGKTSIGIWSSNYPQAVIDRGHSWYQFGQDYDLPAYTAQQMLDMWDAGTEGEMSQYIKADTLDVLAGKLDLDAAALKATVARYNELCDKGVDEDFHKNPDFLIKIEDSGPYYATRNMCLFMTIMGGLRTSPNLEICDAEDNPIPGLFNVGIMVGDMYANNYNFAIPGNNYGINCLTFGYLLGRDLAAGKFD